MSIDKEIEKNVDIKCLPKCAILMAVYNGSEWIDEQLDSLLSQVDVEVSIFISIDLSTDNSYQICFARSELDNRINILPYGERFGGAGKNFYRLIRDVDVHMFDIIAFSDQDDVWLNDKLSTAWRTISRKQCDIYSSDAVAFWKNGKEKLIKKSYPQKKYDYFFEAAGPGCTYVFASYVFSSIKKFILNNSKRCEEVELHDWLIYALCREWNYSWFIDDRPKIRYRQHKNNQVGTNNTIAAYLKRIRSVKSCWYRKQVIAVASIVGHPKPNTLIKPVFMVRNFNELRRRPRDKFMLLLFVVFRVF